MKNDLKPKCSISSKEMKNVSSDQLEKFFDEFMFSFKLRQNDVVYLTGEHNSKIKQVDLKKPDKSALF